MKEHRINLAYEQIVDHQDNIIKLLSKEQLTSEEEGELIAHQKLLKAAYERLEEVKREEDD